MNDADLKKAELMLTIDRNQKYGVTSHVTVGRKLGRITFSPHAELHFAGARPYVFSGSFDITQGRKMEVDLSLENIHDTPMTLKGKINHRITSTIISHYLLTVSNDRTCVVAIRRIDHLQK